MTTAPLRQQPSLRVPGAGRALLVTLVVAGCAAALALSFGGAPQLLGVLVGAAMVAGFFLFGMVNTAVAAAFAPRVALVVALLTYTLQVVALGLVLVAVSRSGLTPDRLDVRWLAGTVIAGALGWTVALVLDALGTTYEVTSEVTSEEVVRR
jgi:ATP synthase protein I